jgi:GNAT superfamily N-acetyltransferase
MSFDPNRFVTRLAVERDSAALAQVFDCTWSASYRGILPHAAFEEPPEECRADYWQRLLCRIPENNLILTAVDEDDDPVGLAVAGPDRFGEKDWAEIYALYVMPGYQRAGLGRRLLRASFRLMHGAGFDSGIVWVLAAHGNRAFYDRLGGAAAHERTTLEWGQPLTQAGYVWPDLAAAFGAAAADSAGPAERVA